MSIRVDDYSLEAYKGEDQIKRPKTEDVYRIAFQQARELFSRSHLSFDPNKVTHQDIEKKVEEVLKGTQYTQAYKEEISKDFQGYQSARETYLELISDFTLPGEISAVRKIDPLLLNEDRYSEKTPKLKQFALDALYECNRYRTSVATLARYQGRIEVLKEEERSKTRI